MYGKKSHARYRLQSFAYSAEYEENPPEEKNTSNPAKRYGDTLNPTTGKLKYTRRNIHAIYGVAWKCQGPEPSKDDLHLIDPDLVTSWRDIPTKVLIGWKLDNGTIHKCWEPRQNLRRRWGKGDADSAIFRAAVEAEKRYLEAESGKRVAKSKSPSVGLDDRHTREQREKSLFPSSRAKSVRSTQRKTPTLDEAKEEFLNNYAELSGVGGFADLTIQDKRDCIKAWTEEKAELLNDSE
jgi:hypothetical protein